MKTPDTTFADTLKAHRTARRLTLDALAERVGCAKSYLSSIETSRRRPPSPELIAALESALDLAPNTLATLAARERAPEAIREDLDRATATRAAAKRLAELLRASPTTPTQPSTLDRAHRSGELRQLIDTLDPQPTDSTTPRTIHDHTNAPLTPLPREVPLINKVAAGYPTNFTDLGFPARTADEYIRCPDLEDPDAFAARVSGDSMTPDYREGDIVVFSPARDVRSGDDCYARLEPDHDSTFKRVFFETDDQGNEVIRLQPLNNHYPPKTHPRDMVAGLYRAVTVMRAI